MTAPVTPETLPDDAIEAFRRQVSAELRPGSGDSSKSRSEWNLWMRRCNAALTGDVGARSRICNAINARRAAAGEQP